MQASNPTRRLLTVTQAAERLGLKERATRQLIANKSLPVIRVTSRAVRVDPLDLENYISSRREGGRVA